ncbi:MAG: hypothetical protein J0M26_05935 [Planctomycetes bacterium]|nr:hypothetical protein [Planctomycetota bacterium]
MARAKYTITDADFSHASSYISDKLQRFEFEFRSNCSSDDARTELFEIVHSSQRQGRAERLNQWGEKYLSSPDWLKLKVGIRKRRERRMRQDAVKTVTISAKAHRLLTKIAKRDGVTFSDVLEHLLARAANSAAKIPKRRTIS